MDWPRDKQSLNPFLSSLQS